LEQACRVCGHSESNARVAAREMMFGWRDAFDYVACAGCGCVQIAEVPDDLGRYYPPDYYSLRPLPDWGRVQRWLRARRLRASIDRVEGGPVGRLLVAARGEHPLGEWIRKSGAGRDDVILDVGAGQGGLVRELRLAGFSRAQGIDPHLPAGDGTGPDPLVRRMRLDDVRGPARLIMFHHVFEHLDDPLSALRTAREIVSNDGTVLVRIPLADSAAWEEYGPDWVQLDAPRHLFLHTRRSIELLAARAGFSVREVRYDSTAFQFWGSAQYRAGLPLAEVDGDRRHPLFSRSEMADFERRAERLNAEQRGDQAAFYLAPLHG
jgi:SAM-dependent methyltransferase